MTSHRTTLLTLVSLVVIAAAMPSSASASPLLSGYGGPGEGDQAILGSALLNGPRGGSGTGAGLPGGGARVGTHRSEAPVSPGHGKQAAGATGQAFGKPSGSHSISERGGSASSAVADSGTLGLSGADLLYALLALCVLAFTAVFTRRLTRVAGREGTSS